MKINIVSFNVPYPANFGGVIDVFYKIKVLKELGVGVVLHTFLYNRRPDSKLQEYCEKVFYYERKTSPIHLISLNPFIVHSRKVDLLKNNLLKNNYPILFEGIHTTGFINDKQLEIRQKIVRMHNIESEYYRKLAFSEDNILKKIYYRLEALKLKHYENRLLFAAHILAISKRDYSILYKKFGSKVTQVNPFHALSHCEGYEGKGQYIIYHGDLSVSDNVKCVEEIVREYVKTDIELPLYIAGLNPPEKLILKLSAFKQVKLIFNPSDLELIDLIRNAHINLIYSNINSGMKLKLVHALILGRFCVANTSILKNTELKDSCITFSRIEEIGSILKNLIQREYFKNEHQERYAILSSQYSNFKSAKKIIELIK